ncbi:zinc-dependent alcohol dehydrogenase [Streptomyces tardus]|nr:alcohol dehydrogenase catalytic domain-containing protein [Streptomyces tardus]
MARTVRALVIDKPGEHRMVTGPVADPGPGEVRVAVHATGLAHSDRALYDGTRAPELARYPVTPGHEWSGTVEAVGEGVDPALVGRRTVGEGLHGCQMCEPCRQGVAGGCVRGYAQTGFTEPGACADVLIIPARRLHLLDDSADLGAATLLEPAAAVAEAVLAGQPLPGSRIAVVGAGTRGLLAVQLLAAHSPAVLHVLDPWLVRAERALPMGASAAVTPYDCAPLYGRCDLVLLMADSGCEPTDACRLARPGGRVVLCGEFESDGQGLDSEVLTASQLTVSAVTGASTRSWAHAVRAFRSGLLDLRPLITDELPLEDFARAMTLLDEDGSGEQPKVLLRP